MAKVDPEFGGKSQPFQLAFFNVMATFKLRELKSEHLGKLMSISGTVTRTTEVKPELHSGTFMCKECNTVNSDIPQ